MYPYEDALIWEIPGQCGLNLGDSSDQALDRLLVLDKVGLKGFIATASGDPVNTLWIVMYSLMIYALIQHKKII